LGTASLGAADNANQADQARILLQNEKQSTYATGNIARYFIDMENKKEASSH
jgi:hypothetical protein